VFRNESGSISKQKYEKLLEMVSLMNDMQKRAFDTVVAHLMGKVKDEKGDSKQLRMLISGEGGTGKSFVISALKMFCRLYFPNDGTALGPVALGAYTGKAAHAISGITLHNMFDLRAVLQDKDGKFAERLEEQWQHKFGNLKLMIVDEVSMVGQDLFFQMDRILKLATLKENTAFGGVHVLFCGDFYQLDPVKDDPAYALSRQFKNKQLGFSAYRT